MSIRSALIEKFTTKQSDLRAAAAVLFPEDDMLDFLRGLGLYIGEYSPDVCVQHCDVIVKFLLRLAYTRNPETAVSQLPCDLQYLQEKDLVLIDQIFDWLILASADAQPIPCQEHTSYPGASGV